MESPVERDRVRNLNANGVSPKGTFVLYWMNNSVRTRYNAALEEAAHLSVSRRLPLRVAFLMDATAADGSLLPERHALFLLQGLADVREALHHRDIPFVAVAPGPGAVETLPALATGAAAVVTDASYLSPGIDVRRQVAAALSVPMFVVEADVVVPVESASNKAEHAARTIRPKITRLLGEYLKPLDEVKLSFQDKDKITCGSVQKWLSEVREHDDNVLELNLDNVEEELKTIDGLDRGAPPVSEFHGGQTQAQKVLKQFLKEKLLGYGTGRNEPVKQLQSDLSPYLRAGNISPVDIALQTKDAARGKKSSAKESEASFLEELIVRRELAVNACWFNPGSYDVYDNIVPAFAKASLELHKADKRPVVYSYEELEAGVTGDAYWNAAQLELVVRGKMHGYMRMYWAKQILGWVEDPATAMEYALRLNNRWELDAVDPNSYAGVIWCFGLHDQGWRERPIWGKVRYMNDAGLKRKFNMPAYVEMVNRMAEKEGLPQHIAELRKTKRIDGPQQKTIQQTIKRRRSTSKKTSQATKATAAREKRDALLNSIKRLRQ